MVRITEAVVKFAEKPVVFLLIEGGHEDVSNQVEANKLIARIRSTSPELAIARLFIDTEGGVTSISSKGQYTDEEQLSLWGLISRFGRLASQGGYASAREHLKLRFGAVCTAEYNLTSQFT